MTTKQRKNTYRGGFTDDGALSDYELRPWVINEQLDKQLEDELEFLDSAMSIATGYSTNQGNSEIDNKPKELVEFQKLVSNPNWIDVDYLATNDGIIENNDLNDLNNVAKLELNEKTSADKFDSTLTDDKDILLFLHEYNRANRNLKKANKHKSRSSLVNRLKSVAYDNRSQNLPKQESKTTTSLFKNNSYPYKSNPYHLESAQYTQSLESMYPFPPSPIVPVSNMDYSYTSPSLSNDNFDIETLPDRKSLIDKSVTIEESIATSSKFTKGSNITIKKMSNPLLSEVAQDEEGPEYEDSDILTKSYRNMAKKRISKRLQEERSSAATGLRSADYTNNSLTNQRPSSARPISSDSKSGILSRPSSANGRMNEENKNSSTALNKLTISGSLGFSKASLFLSRRVQSAKTIRDQLMTTSGVYSLTADPDYNQAFKNKDELLHLNKFIANQVREKNLADHTWTILSTPGYMEAVGPENVFKSDIHINFSDTELKQLATKNADVSTHGLKRFGYAEWVENAARNHQKIFVPSGSQFKV